MKNKDFSIWIGCATLASGASALIYQTLWMRSFSVLFGSTTQAMSVVLAAFMGGLALGNLAIAKLKPAHAQRAYAWVEAGIAACALLSLPLLGWIPAGDPLPKAILAGLTILPATVLAGATVPLLMEILGRQGGGFHGGFGWLYKINTLGAALGVFASTFFLVPGLGTHLSMAAAAGGNLLAAGLALRFGKGGALQTQPAPEADGGAGFPLLLALAAFACGLSAFSLELLWSRSLSLVLGSSIYSFNLMLMALLCGLALGTWIYERRRERLGRPARALAWAFLALGLLIVAQLALIGQLPALWMALIQRVPPAFGSYQALGFCLCFFSLLAVTTLQGFCFPGLAHLGDARQAGPRALSAKLYAANTLGAILGALLTGFVLVPKLGLQAPFILAAALPLGLGAWMLPEKPARKAALLALAALAVAPLLAWYRPWNPAAMSGGVYLYGLRDRFALKNGESYAAFLERSEKLAWYKEGAEAVVSVRQNGAVTSLQVNGKTDASDGDTSTQKLAAQIPLALHPAPKSALIIGWGSGCTVGSALLHPLERAEVVEIEPATYEAAPWFESMNHGCLKDPRLKAHVDDGRNFLLRSREAYDVIISEPSNPWIKGISSLFTLDHYRLAASRLAKGGLFCQWFYYYNLSAQDLKMQLRTFAAAFPQATLWLVPPPGPEATVMGDILMVGSAGPQTVDLARLKRLFADPAVGGDFKSVGVMSPLSFVLGYLGDRKTMQAVAGDGPLNQDAFPLLEFSAPKLLYLEREALNRLNLENFGLMERAADSWPALDHAPEFSRPSAAFLREAGHLALAKVLSTRAEALLRGALQKEPGSAAAWADLGSLASRRRERAAEAEGYFLKALGLSPGFRPARTALGKLYLANARYEDALKSYQAMARRDPGDFEAWLGQGFAYLKLNDRNSAKAMFERCLKLNPENEPAKKILAKINAL